MRLLTVRVRIVRIFRFLVSLVLRHSELRIDGSNILGKSDALAEKHERNERAW